MKSKKIFIVGILIIVLVFLTGCGSSKKDGNNADGENKRLADVVEVGDYVNYDANSGLVEPVTYKTDENLTGDSTSTTFSSKDSMNWRVLSVDRESGKIELISTDPTPNFLYLSGRTGYINAEDVLDDIGAVYGKGKGAIGGRSVNIEDIEQYSSYDPTTYSTGFKKYGNTYKYTDGNYFVGIGDGAIEGGIANTDEGYTECLKATSTNPVTAKQTYYDYTAQNYFENETIYETLFRNAGDIRNKIGTRNYFWLASRCVRLYDYDCDFVVRCVRCGYVYGYDLASSNNSGASNIGNRVVPVVSLESNILTNGKDASGAWNLKVD